MATAPTAGYIYLIESDNADNDDWITDHAGDPDLLDLDAYTEGTEYCKIEIPQKMQKNYWTGIKVTDMSGGKSAMLRTRMRGFEIMSQGLMTSRSNAEKVEEFINKTRHVAGSSSTFKQYYLIVYYGTNDHELFTDHNGTQQHYCKGAITAATEVWDGTSPATKLVKLNFRSTW